MIRHKRIDVICIIICLAAILFTAIIMNRTAVSKKSSGGTSLYQDKIFADDKVHTLDIEINESDWQDMLDNASTQEYVKCDVVIDGEKYKNVAIRTKGNSSLSAVTQLNSDRYSLKIEFDHYNDDETYYGLDKLSLNNIVQDSTFMKDYLCYHMMNDMGVPSPLSSYVNISVNGETFGLYIAAEGIEESFVIRNYGSVTGNLYKPDKYQNNQKGNDDNDMKDGQSGQNQSGRGKQQGNQISSKPAAGDKQNITGRGGAGGGFGGGFGGMSSDDGSTLVYTDDNLDSYSTIWDGAVFDATDTDKERLVASLKQLNSGKNLDEVVNIDEVLNYFVVHNFVLNFDSYTSSMTHNYYLYEKNGVMSMLPWDYNLAFGAFSGGNGNSGGSSSATALANFPIDTPFSGATLDERPILGKLLENDKYMSLYHQYFNKFITKYFDNGEFGNLVDKTETLIAPYIKKDPTAFYDYDEFETAVSTLKKFCKLRAESISGQLDGTIPSTTDGQTADSSSLIDASSITISDMGSNGGGGGGMKNISGGNKSGTSGSQTSSGTEQSSGSQSNEKTNKSFAIQGKANSSASSKNSSARNSASQNWGTGSMPSNQNNNGLGQKGNAGAVPPNGGGGGGGMQNNNKQKSSSTSSSSSSAMPKDIILLSASAAMLILGFIFVRKYRK